jgi:translation elongation factor EF-Tu-like GTPase
MIVEAEIHLLSTAEGGRSNPIAATRYRPNHKFEGFDDYTIGQVDLIAVASLEPGQSASAKVTFIRRPGLADQLCVGAIWQVYEGLRRVGWARVIGVLEH